MFILTKHTHYKKDSECIKIRLEKLEEDWKKLDPFSILILFKSLFVLANHQLLIPKHNAILI
jgi:hypothetical protein